MILEPQLAESIWYLFPIRLVHWDVNNENLHGDWFEKNSTDPDITLKMFQWIHDQEPETKLFLNDYSAIPQPAITTVKYFSLTLSLVVFAARKKSITLMRPKNTRDIKILPCLKAMSADLRICLNPAVFLHRS